MSEVELELNLEGVERVKRTLDQFPSLLKESLYRSYQRSASREEKILKDTAGFNDRTGHLRRTLYVVATFNPLGMTLGAAAKYAYWVAFGHGTWKGNWWLTYLSEALPRIVRDVEKGLDNAVKRFNEAMGRMS